MGGVAQKRHAAEFPRWEWVPVHHGVLVDLLGTPNEFGHIEEVEYERRERLNHFLAARDVGPVLRWHHGVRGCLECRHPVDKCPTLLFLDFRDRVDHNPLFARSCIDHRPTGQEGLAERYSTPHDHTVPPGRTFVGMERAADRRVDAVASHQQVSLGPTDHCLGPTADKLCPCAATRRLPEALQMILGMDAVRAEAIDHRPVQNAEQFPAMNRKLWPAVAGVDSERLGIDLLAEFRVVEELGRGDADRGQLVQKSQFD